MGTRRVWQRWRGVCIQRLEGKGTSGRHQIIKHRLNTTWLLRLGWQGDTYYWKGKWMGQFQPLYLLPSISVLFPSSRANGEGGGKLLFCLPDFSPNVTDSHSSRFLATHCESGYLGNTVRALKSILMKPEYHWQRNNEVVLPASDWVWSRRYCLIKVFSLETVLRSILYLQIYSFKGAYT